MTHENKEKKKKNSVCAGYPFHHEAGTVFVSEPTKGSKATIDILGSY